jgi:hypothetical protein
MNPYRGALAGLYGEIEQRTIGKNNFIQENV